jgi:hypothetical protein
MGFVASAPKEVKMSPCAVREPFRPVLFPESASRPWFEREDESDRFDADDPVASEALAAALNDAELMRLAGHFLERTELLIDAVAPPPWEDEDDLFEGEVFDDEQADYQRLASFNLAPAQKEDAARELMASEAARYQGCSGRFLIALALTYRRILLDPAADPSDKVEILRRVYSSHEPEWMTAEIVYLHFILLDQCRYLCRASANMERKEETLRWIFTDPELEDRPFSFKNCVRLVTGNPPDFGAVYRRVQEAMRPALAAWLSESLARKRAADDRQPELFDM